MIYIAYVFLLLSVVGTGLALLMTVVSMDSGKPDIAIAAFSGATCFGVLAIAFKVIFA